MGEEYWKLFPTKSINHCSSWITQGGGEGMVEKNEYKLGIPRMEPEYRCYPNIP